MPVTIQTQFNLIADQYDANRKKFIVSNIETQKRILDLGVGTGLLSYFWYQHCSASEYVLVNIANDMLNVARKRFVSIKNISYEISDHSAGLPAGEFDVVVPALSIPHLENEDKIKLFAQIYDKLPKGGLFVN